MRDSVEIEIFDGDIMHVATVEYSYKEDPVKWQFSNQIDRAITSYEVIDLEAYDYEGNNVNAVLTDWLSNEIDAYMIDMGY